MIAIHQHLSKLATSVISGAAVAARSMAGAKAMGSEFMPFYPGGLGNFPYYYLDPATMLFNAHTYRWINSSLAKNIPPIMPGSGLFSNYFLSAISKTTYALSSADQAVLNAAQANTTNQQAALLLQWKIVFGFVPEPSGNMQPIDRIINTICTEWATSPTDLTTLQHAPYIEAVLNNTPANARGILPFLASFINALDGAAGLLSATSMNNGYLRRSLAALQFPSEANGGMAANDRFVYPAYNFITPLPDILAGLNNDSNTITLDITISSLRNGQVSVSIAETESFNAMADDLLSIVLDDDANYFSAILEEANGPVHLRLIFKGVTLVNFEPATFDKTTGRNWYWPEAIQNAVANGRKDVTGFRFSPDPGIDFSNNGPFGFLTALVISSQPTIQFTTHNLDSNAVQAKVQNASVVKISLLNTPLGLQDGPINVTSATLVGPHTTEQNLRSSIAIDPAPALTIAVPAVDSTAWVHGVQTVFPAAGAFS